MISKLLRSATVPLGLNKPDLGRYFFPESLLKSIEYTTLSGFYNGKHLLLASPHPGAGVSIKKLSLFMAQKSSSDHFSLDYHWFVHASKLLSKQSSPRPQIKDSKPFSPSAYEAFDENDQSEQEMDEDKFRKVLISFDGEKGFIVPPNIKGAVEEECSSGTHYDTHISKDDLDAILNGLKEFIRENRSRAIISIPDVTDMSKFSSNWAG